jgi:hypothetical protein
MKILRVPQKSFLKKGYKGDAGAFTYGLGNSLEFFQEQMINQIESIILEHCIDFSN